MFLYILATIFLIQTPLHIACGIENSNQFADIIGTKGDAASKIEPLNVGKLLDSTPLPYTESIVEDNEWDELKVDAMIECWSQYKKTSFDRWGIKKLLRFAPAGSQGTIKSLVKNEQANKILCDICDVVKTYEDSLLFYWDYANDLHYDAKDLYYSKVNAPFFNTFFEKMNDRANKNVALLEISQFLEVTKPAVSLLAAMGVGSVVSGFIWSKILKSPFSWKNSFLSGIKEPIRKNTFKPVVFKDASEVNLKNKWKLFRYFTEATAGDNYMVSKAALNNSIFGFIKNKKVQNIFSSSIAGLGLGVQTAWYDYNLYSLFRDSYKRLKFLQKVTKKLQNKLTDVAHILRGLKKVDELANCDAALRDCPIIKSIQAFLAKEDLTQELTQLLELLESSTFEGKKSLLFSRGRLLKAHRMMQELKQKLVPFLQNIGLLGGYRMIAQLFKDHENKRVKYCFVDFFESEKPLIQLKNGWAPLISEDDVVTNDINLGENGLGVNAVFTGPNGLGKTTSMITIALNVLLSKLGIAAADEARMSHFAKIRTSLTPLSDITRGLSSFMAEQKRVQEVRKDIQDCEGKILVLLDEPYKGTVEAESAERVRKFGKEVSDISHCSLLMATHLEKPILLADDTKGIFANYQMYAEEKNDDTFIRTFKLKDGPAMWWFHDAKKRGKFIDWLCTQEGVN